MKIDHVNIVVLDMDRSIAFYTRLGLTKTLDTIISGAWVANVIGIHDENLEARVVFMDPDVGTARLEMIQYLAPQGQSVSANSHSNTIGVRHFALVVDDIFAIYQALLHEGFTFFSEPQEVTGNKAVEARIGRKTQVYLLDPDGIIVELAHYRSIESA